MGHDNNKIKRRVVITSRPTTQGCQEMFLRPFNLSDSAAIVQGLVFFRKKGVAVAWVVVLGPCFPRYLDR